MSDPRTEIAIGLWHKFASPNHIEWEDESHKAEYLMAVDGITTGQLFNLLLKRINFDTMDPRSLSLAELHGAIEGAEWPILLTAKHPEIVQVDTAETQSNRCLADRLGAWLIPRRYDMLRGLCDHHSQEFESLLWQIQTAMRGERGSQDAPAQQAVES